MENEKANEEKNVERTDTLALSIVSSLAIGAVLAIVVPVLLASLWLRLDSNWFWLAPGWGLLKPGPHDFALLLSAFVLNAGLYALLTWAIMFFFFNVGRNRFR